MTSADQIKAVAASRGPVEIARLLGFSSLRRRGRVLRGPCPLHGGDADAFAIFEAPSGVAWTCHTHCGGGDFLALIAAQHCLEVRGDFPRVLTLAAELLGLEVGDGNEEPRGLSVAELDRIEAAQEAKREELERLESERRLVLNAFVEACPLGGDALHYLRHERRCWTRGDGWKPATDLGLGFFWGAETIERVRASVGTDAAREVLGVGPEKCLRRAAQDFERHPLILPVTGSTGGFVAFQGRSIDPNCDKRRRYTSRGTGSAGFFGARDLADSDRLVVLTEGALDCLTLRVHARSLARHWGPFVAVGRPGVGGGLSDPQAAMLAGRRVLVAFDGDKAGAEGLRRAVERLHGVGASVQTLRLPNDRDINAMGNAA